MQKLGSQVRILVQKGDWVDSINGDSFCVQDVLGGYLLPQSGDSGSGGEPESESDNPTLSSLQWQGQRAFESIDSTLEFLAFTGEGGVFSGIDAAIKHSDTKTKTVTGFAVKSRYVLRNVIINRRLPGDPKVNNGLKEWKWRAKLGESWETLVPARVPYRNIVRHRVSSPNRVLAIDTEHALDEKHGFALDLDFAGIWSGHDGDAGVRLQWCDGLYSVTWRVVNGRKINKPQLERKLNGQWECWQVFGDAADVDFSTPTLFQVEYVDGRMLVTIGDVTRHFAQDVPSSVPRGSNTSHPIHAPSGRVVLTSEGVDVGVGGGVLDYKTTSGKNRSGSFVRRVRTSFRHKGTIAPKVAYAGYYTPTAKATFEVSSQAGYVEYAAQLKTNGRETPFLANVIISFKGDKSGNESDVIDLRPACRTLKYSGGQPDLMPTTQVEVELDRTLLKNLVPDWQIATGQFRPLRVDTRDAYLSDDGQNIVYEDWEGLFDGYILDPAMATPSFNTQTLKIIAHDKMIRVKEPAGLIDEKYGPLDSIYADNNGPLFGGNAIKYLAEVELGSDVADKINGNGDPMAFMPQGTYPLMGADNDLPGYKAMTLTLQSQFQYPPPFDSYWSDWTDQIAKDDNAVRYFGHSPLAPQTGNVLIYGRLRLILAAMGENVLVLPDAIYEPGDANNIINKIEARSLTDKALNQIIVRGRRAADGLAAFMPSLFSGRARVSPDDPNSPEKAGWLRTRVVHHDFIGESVDGSFAQTMATLLLQEFEGVIPRDVTITLPRGNTKIHWGKKISPKLQRAKSDQTIGLDGVVLRVKQVDHNWDFSGEDALKHLETTIIARELSGSGF